jgi:hypothetical protein
LAGSARRREATSGSRRREKSIADSGDLLHSPQDDIRTLPWQTG